MAMVLAQPSAEPRLWNAPDSLARSTSADRGAFLTAATRGDRSLAIRRVTGARVRLVHDRSITSPRQVSDRLRRIQSLTRHTVNPWCMTPRLAATSRSGHSAARHSTVLVFHPSGGHAHPLPLSRAWMRWRGPIQQPAHPGRAGTNKASPPPGTSSTAKNRPIGARRRAGNGTKRARTGKASGYTHR